MLEPVGCATKERSAPRAEDFFFEDLLPALLRLDGLIQRAVIAAEAAYGSGAFADFYRGLHIPPEEVDQLLRRQPGAPILHPGEDECEPPPSEVLPGNNSRLSWLARAFDRSPFDLDIIIIALAPETDLRYERLYACLQNNVSRRRSSVDLALNLLCPTARAKLARRAQFAAQAPLLHHGLLHLVPDTDHLQPPLLAHYLKLDDQIVGLLLGQDSLDSRLASICRLMRPTVAWHQLCLDNTVKQGLVALGHRSRQTGRPLRLCFQGPKGSGRGEAVQALATALGLSLLIVDMARVLEAKTDWTTMLRLLFREAWFKGALLYLDGLDGLRDREHALNYQNVLAVLAEDSGITIMSGTQPWAPPGNLALGVVSVQFGIPTTEQRRECWQTHLAAEGLALDPGELTTISERFRLTPGQIADAAATAVNLSVLRTATDKTIQPGHSFTMDDLLAAARAQSGHELASLAPKVDARYTWDDIVLPQDTREHLREMCQWVAYRHRVLGEWGFDRKLSQGKGIDALFAGPSGTGKTMAAEVIANELGLDLYRIDLSGVVSKHISETEKNLDRIFIAAESANAILFFDEADALFGKRSEVRDSHDRYANIEISYSLQKMEQYEGIAILATNLRQNLDDAFVRRMAFTIHFPFPDEESRLRIWAGIWPKATPLIDGMNLDFLARQFKLSGGNSHLKGETILLRPLTSAMLLSYRGLAGIMFERRPKVDLNTINRCAEDYALELDKKDAGRSFGQQRPL